MKDDLISRQAAIDAIDKVAEMFPYRIPGQAKTYRQYNEAWSDACDASEAAIEGLPSAQPDTSCDGCRYGYFVNAVCDRCSRMYTDRYEREIKKDAAD